MVRRISHLLLLAPLSLVSLTACGGGPGGGEPPPTHTVPTYWPPEDNRPWREPDTDTNPCAFPGDPLCPDTPIRVPPPHLPEW
jgi:hypothetical protein